MHNLQQLYFDSENGDELDDEQQQQNTIPRYPNPKVANQSG